MDYVHRPTAVRYIGASFHGRAMCGRLTSSRTGSGREVSVARHTQGRENRVERDRKMKTPPVHLACIPSQKTCPRKPVKRRGCEEITSVARLSGESLRVSDGIVRYASYVGNLETLGQYV